MTTVEAERASGEHRNPNLVVDQSRLLVGEGQGGSGWKQNLRGIDSDWLTADVRPATWWTGKPPQPGVCPGVAPDGTITPLPSPNVRSVTRRQAREYWDNSWTLTEVLFSGLRGEEAFYSPPYHQQRHPLIFYYMHVACFYVNKFNVAGMLTSGLDSHMEELFEVGVDSMAHDDMSKNEREWPPVNQCREYRRGAYKMVLNVIDTHDTWKDEDTPVAVGWNDPMWALFLGVGHEQIHLDTSSCLMREHPVSMLRRPKEWPAHEETKKLLKLERAPGDVPPNTFVTIPETAVTLGRGEVEAATSYGWDNEFGVEEPATVPEVEVCRFLCTNAEYLEFVQTGAYLDRKYWTKDGWAWREYRNTKAPTYWCFDGAQGTHKYKLRTLWSVDDMPWSAPVIVNYFEADAYVTWRNESEQKEGRQLRLLTELEHVAIRPEAWRPGGSEDPTAVYSGRQLLDQSGPWLQMATESEVAVDSGHPTELGVYDSIGNAWCWVEDWFHPLEGFQLHRMYPDFSLPCFQREHRMILGGSFLSSGSEGGVHARYQFRPFFFQHAGFRVARTKLGQTRPLQSYDIQYQQGEATVSGEEWLGRVLELNYGGAPEGSLKPAGTDEFAQKCAELVKEWCTKSGTSTGSALQLGCGLGATAFRLAGLGFEKVVAVDKCLEYLEVAKVLQKGLPVAYQVALEGEIMGDAEAKLQGADVAAAGNVEFAWTDACELPHDFGVYDAVFLGPCLSRLAAPESALQRMGAAGGNSVVKPGGILVLASTWSWSVTSTLKLCWLGGTGGVRSETTVKDILSPDFELLHTVDMPFSVREHSRKWDYFAANVTVWRRRT